MQRFFLTLLALALLVSFSACAKDNNMYKPVDMNQVRIVDEYTPPTIAPPTSEQLKLVINKPAKQVLKLIEDYADSPEAVYVVTHVVHHDTDKSLAVLMLSLPNPENCMDCGINNFAYYHSDELVNRWEYPVAQKEIVMEFAANDSLSRFMALTAKATITIVPVNASQTEISVMVDYAMERKVTGYTRRQLGDETIIIPVAGISIAKFNSTQVGDLEDSVLCVSKGAVEFGILKGIKDALQ